MAKLRQSKVLNQFGKPAATWLYPSPRWNQRQYKPRYWLSADSKNNISEYDRWELVNYSRQLFAQVGTLNTAVRQKNSWAFGDAWDAHYVGTNPKWGEEAEDWLKYQFYPNCNVRGPLYGFKKTMFMSGMSWDYDGDDAMILTESATGFPQFAIIPATRIGGASGGLRGMKSDSVVSGGPYDGAKLFDGVIYDRNNRMVAIRVAGEDGEPQDISSYSADLCYEPDWSDQGRGVPRISTCLLRWMDRQDIDDFLRSGMKRAASVGIIVKNEEGEAGLGNEVITGEDNPNAAAGTDNKLHYEELQGGEAYYLRANQGEEISALNYQNPHPNSEAFIERMERECLGSLGWFYELLNLHQTGRAPSRLVCDLANQTVWDRQSTGYRRGKRAIGYAIAKAMKKGLLSKNNDGMDPYLWEFGLPKQLTVDQGNEEQADRENLKMGTTSKAIIAQKKGYHRKEISKQRLEELRELITDATAINAEFPSVPFDKAMELLEQRSPNPIMQDPNQGQTQQPTKP